MYRNVFLSNSIILLIFMVCYMQSLIVRPANLQMFGFTTTTTKRPSRYYDPTNNGYDSSNKYYNKGYGYGNGYNYDKYGDMTNGIDSDKYGTDIADYGPVKKRGKRMKNYLHVWIYEDGNWEQKNKGSYGSKKKGYGKQYNDKNYDDDNYQGSSKKKRSYSRVSFPVKQIKNYRQFPIGRFPPLISALPWVPVFYDKLTYQTYIFSMTGGMYIIPPLINFYGQRFAVAQLIKWGYASLVSSGAPPPPSVDVAPLVQPAPAGGAAVAALAPTYDSKTLRFSGGVKTNFQTFRPKYPQVLEEGGNDPFSRSSKQNNDFDPGFGGPRTQEVRPQGGSRGGYNY